MRYLAGFFLILATSAQADIKFDQITQSDLDKIANELSANFAHSTVSGASSLGKLFGVQVGLVGGMTKTPDIDSFVKRVDATQTADKVYNAAISAQVTVPFGITAEASYFPSMGSDSFKFGNMGLGVKWTFSDLLSDWPVDVAVKANVTTTTLSFKQTINNASTGNVPVDSTVEYKNTILGYGLFVSKRLPFVEPYLGICMLSSKSDLGVAGQGSIFNQTFTSSQSASSSPSGTMLTLGADLSLLFIRLGAEYSSLLGTSRYLGKLAFSF
jgi:hypothetical protein